MIFLIQPELDAAMSQGKFRDNKDCSIDFIIGCFKIKVKSLDEQDAASYCTVVTEQQLLPDNSECERRVQMSAVNQTSASARGGAGQRKEKDHCTFNTVALFFAASSHLIFCIQFAVKLRW